MMSSSIRNSFQTLVRKMFSSPSFDTIITRPNLPVNDEKTKKVSSLMGKIKIYMRPISLLFCLLFLGDWTNGERIFVFCFVFASVDWPTKDVLQLGQESLGHLQLVSCHERIPEQLITLILSRVFKQLKSKVWSTFEKKFLSERNMLKLESSWNGSFYAYFHHK